MAFWGGGWGMRGVLRGAIVEWPKALFYRLMGNMGYLYIKKEI